MSSELVTNQHPGLPLSGQYRSAKNPNSFYDSPNIAWQSHQTQLDFNTNNVGIDSDSMTGTLREEDHKSIPSSNSCSNSNNKFEISDNRPDFIASNSKPTLGPSPSFSSPPPHPSNGMIASSHSQGSLHSYEKLGIVTSQPKEITIFSRGGKIEFLRQLASPFKARDLAKAGYFFTGLLLFNHFIFMIIDIITILINIIINNIIII